MKRVDLIEQVLVALKSQWEDFENFITYDDQAIDALRDSGVVRILGIEFYYIVEPEINGSSLHRVEDKLKSCSPQKNLPILLMVRYVQPSVYDLLRQKRINFADASGNYHIVHTKGKKLIFQLSHTGEAPLANKVKRYPLFQEAGLKVVFYLLQSPENVSKPFREIKEHSGVAIGTVKHVVDELIARKFIFITQKKRVLRESRLLLNLWVENYHQVLKPKLLLKKLDFRTSEQKENWKGLSLPTGMFWGGECASNLLNDYLSPATFELYTEVPFSHLMRSGEVRTTEGDISVYQKFWGGDTMPLILIYADLIGSEDSRCIEAANKLLNDELSDFK